MPDNIRFSSTSASRRILALEFVRRYFNAYGASPSFNEIAASLRVDRQRVSALVRDLEQAGELFRTPGVRRGLRLKDATEEIAESQAVAILISRGWKLTDLASAGSVSIPQLTRSAPSADIAHMLGSKRED